MIVGSHYDAWTYGAAEANSGTAIVMELAKAFGQMVKKGQFILLI